jgi:hypothetical protein
MGLFHSRSTEISSSQPLPITVEIAQIVAQIAQFNVFTFLAFGTAGNFGLKLFA